jgi:PAS domain S-box-containing protein
MDTSENDAEEVRRLRRTMRDLVALSTLPAVWIGLGPEGIARSLAEVLRNTLSLDLIYVRLAGLNGEGVVEVARCKHGADAEDVEAVRASLAPLLSDDRAELPANIPAPSGSGMLHFAVTRFGVGDDHGVLVAGSRNADFPTERDRLLLGVGANQTAIVVQRRRAEERLHEQREWLATTLSSIGDAVIATDVGGRVRLMNPIAEALTGWPHGEAVGRPIEDVFRIVNEHTRLASEHPIARVLREGVIVGLANQTVLIARDGTETPIEDRAAPIRGEGGTPTGVVMVFRDVTEERAARRLVRETEGRHRTILESITDAFFALGHDWRFTYVNRQAEALLGRNRGDLLGKGFWEEYAPALGTGFEHGYRRVMDEKLTVTFEEFYPPHDRWYEVHAYPSPDGLSVYFRDATARRRVDEELRAAKEEAENANKAKDRFLAVLSHELRTPLNPILLAATSILERPDSPEELRPTLEMICQNVNLQARLIDDLLDVMRIVQGKMPLHWEVADGHGLIRQAVQICRIEIQGKGLRLDVDLAATQLHVNCDPARFQQVFWNLIKNAVKFTPEGGVVSVQTRNEEIPGGRDGSMVIEVSDTGIGIEPNVLPTIWDPFQQGETTITRRFGGLGLGLAICKAIVEAHGGTIAALSEGKGRGTKFRIVLKAMPDPAVEGNGQRTDPGAKPEGDLSPATPLRILVVEDEDATRRLMARLLSAQGHEVTTAGTLAEATEATHASEFDLIVSDIGLPDGSGLDVMRRVAARRGPVPAIALTGYGMEEDIVRSREAGFTAHMTKPIDFNKLLTMIRRVAGGAREKIGDSIDH